MLIRRKWNRRRFLRAAGIFGATSALLPLLPRIGEAAGPPPKRLLLLSTGNGSILPMLRPTRGGAALRNGDALSGSTSEILQPLLDRHADSMLLIDGVDISTWFSGTDFGSHGAHTALWNGLARSSAPSVDQVIADHIGGGTAIHSLQTATFEPQDDSISSYGTDGASTALPNTSARSATFDRLFRGFTPPDAGAAPVVDHAPARRQRSFDVLRGEIARLRRALFQLLALR